MEIALWPTENSLMAYYWAMDHSLGTSGLDKLGLRRVMKTDIKTDKWKSDRALERIKN